MAEAPGIACGVRDDVIADGGEGPRLECLGDVDGEGARRRSLGWDV